MTEIDTSTAAIAALMDGVTAGPWEQDGPISAKIVWAGPDVRVCFMTSDGPASKNARFIAAARYLVPALAAERDALKAGVDLLLWPPLCGQPNITDVYQLLDSADRAHAAMCRSLEMTSTLVGDMAASIRELCAERDAAVARAERAEARVEEIEAELRRALAHIESLDAECDRRHAETQNHIFTCGILNTEIERLLVALGAEQDSADEMANVLSAFGDGLMFDVDRLQAALDQHDALREAAIRAIPMPTDAAATLERLTAQARAQGMREAAEIAAHRYAVCEDAFSKGFGAEERHCALEAKHIEDKIIARAEEIENEARNG